MQTGDAMTRKEANLELIRLLQDYVTVNPDMRLGQALVNMGIVVSHKGILDQGIVWHNHFNEEPQEMLERVVRIKKVSEVHDLKKDVE